MTAFNAVRFRVKSGRDQDFLDAHKKVERNWAGLQHVNIIKTSDRTYCIIAEWSDMEALGAARPNMISTLDSFRDTLEDLGNGLGVTDPVSGPVVLTLKLTVSPRFHASAECDRPTCHLPSACRSTASDGGEALSEVGMLLAGRIAATTGAPSPQKMSLFE